MNRYEQRRLKRLQNPEFAAGYWAMEAELQLMHVIEAIRKHQHISQETLAERMGKKRESVSRILSSDESAARNFSCGLCCADGPRRASSTSGPIGALLQTRCARCLRRRKFTPLSRIRQPSRSFRQRRRSADSTLTIWPAARRRKPSPCTITRRPPARNTPRYIKR